MKRLRMKAVIYILLQHLIQFTYGSSDPNGQLATIFIPAGNEQIAILVRVFDSQQLLTHHRKDKVSRMIENMNEANRNLEKALQALEQAKQRAANEKKK